MTQHRPDFRQGIAVAQHLGGECVAKLMRAPGGRIDAGTFDGLENDPPDRTGALQITDRGACPQKDPPAGTWRSSVAEVGDDRLAHISG